MRPAHIHFLVVRLPVFANWRRRSTCATARAPRIRFDMRLSRESAAGKISGRVGADPPAILKQPAEWAIPHIGAGGGLARRI